MAGGIIDRFGESTPFLKRDEGHFLAVVSVAVSMQFLGWVMALGDGVKIIGPEKVLDWMKDEIRRLNEAYLEGGE